jgi:hypothetical protein
MAFAFLLALQAAQAAPAPEPAPAPAMIDFDLARLQAADTSAAARLWACTSRDPEEIMVCAPRPIAGAYPYERMARLFAEEPLVAETGIGGGATARAYVESVQLGNGMISNRAMVGVKLPF